MTAPASAPIIRWTIGDVSPAGFETLRLSIWGAHALFGDRASYIVCLNSVPLDDARDRAGALPAGVEWRVVTRDDLAPVVRAHLDGGLAEGVGWKFAPLRLADDRPELALDNDCILWDLPDALRRWIDRDGDARVIAEDVRACFGQFAPLCGDRPRNSGIRALPGSFDVERHLRDTLSRVPAMLHSELDEQGLQVAAVSLDGEPDVVRLDEVSICSPFPPHLPEPGRCGVHFVGVNAHTLPWSFEGRPATDYIQDHWRRWRDSVTARVRALRH